MPADDAALPRRGAHLSSVDVNFLDLDLNLLIALDALLGERSVTGAAELLHRSQPALSASLKRLRHQFQDDLLVRVGNRFELTPLARQLESRVATVLADAERLFAARSRFDPSSSTREFVLRTADYGQVMLGRLLAEEIAAEAPSVKLRYRPLSDSMLADAVDTLRAVDGLVLPRGLIDGFPSQAVYEDRWVLLVDRRNRRVGDSLSLDDLAGLDWVLPFHERQGSSVPAVRQLQLLGVDLTVVVALEGFLSLPLFVAGTDRITILQARLADEIAPASRFRWLECPFDAVPLIETLWWHPSLERDPGHRWLRSVVERVGARLSGGSEAGPRS